MNNIAVIPARKGSKRIKNKNIILFKGKPMIYWTIIAAKKSKIFKKIYVDTDCKKIKKISVKFGAEVPFLRNKQYAKDNISVNASTFKFLQSLKKNKSNLKIDNIFQLMPNCPFRDEKDIKKMFNNFKKLKCKFMISHVKFYFANPWWAIIKKKNKVSRIFKDSYKKRSQDLPEMLSPSGAIWIANYNSFVKSRTFYGKNYQQNLLEWKKGIDIDTKQELRICKTL